MPRFRSIAGRKQRHGVAPTDRTNVDDASGRPSSSCRQLCERLHDHHCPDEIDLESGQLVTPGAWVASATTKAIVLGGRARFHGYECKLQTRHDSGHAGAHDDMVHENLIGSFALVDYPAVYRSLGAMTLRVDHQGNGVRKTPDPHPAGMQSA